MQLVKMNGTVLNKNIDREDIEKQLSKILSSSRFTKSKILCNFLSYIVDETLEGNEITLKEYVIATRALGRDENFNPQTDAVVRIHANRLRKQLNEYYLNDGLRDQLRISIPKGRYIPVFEELTLDSNSASNQEPYNLAELTSKPRVAVLPFTKFQENDRLNVICSVLRQDLSIELSKFSELNVISNYSISTVAKEPSKLNDFLNIHKVNYALSGSCIMEGEELKFNVELNYRNNRQIVWAESFVLDNIEGNELSSFRPTIHKILATLCGHFGLIYQNEMNAHHPSDYAHLYAVYCHKVYHREFSEEAFHAALEAVTVGLKNNPSNALLTAFHAEIYLNMVIIMENKGDIDFLKEGTVLAKKAVKLDENNQHAYQVLAWANMLNHDKKAFYRNAEKCLQVNPNNVMYTGAMGFGYVCAGDYEKGFALMSSSVSLNPYFELAVTTGHVLYHIHINKFDIALDWAEKINKPHFLWDALFRISIHGLLQQTDDLAELKSTLFTLSPSFTQRARKIVAAFILDATLQEKIIEGLIIAGIEIDD